MKKLFLILGLLITGIIAVNVAHANSIFEIKGSGVAVVNDENPKIYTSSFRISLTDQSSISKGYVIITGNDLHIYAKFVPDKWTFSYANDGSFHGSGLAQTVSKESYDVVLDGKRAYATNSGSMWKLSVTMQGVDKKFNIDYLVIGNDPYPTIGVTTDAKVLIPNGNSALANTGFFLPLNLEVIRGTTVIWQNEDNIGHTIQSQDNKGNAISMFNSNVLKTGDTFSYKFNKPGVYHYYCTIHPWRIGVVTVS